MTAPLLDLTTTPDPASERATQLLHGETFTVYERRPDGRAWGQAALDGYVGYVDSRHLGRVIGSGRRVTALWSHLYERPLVRGAIAHELPFLAEIPVCGTSGAFAKLRGGGFVPTAHLAPLAGDFVAQAERFVGVPYLWGGRSVRGIDCSGLVQMVLLATGRIAPRDTDMQAALLGAEIGAPDAAAPRRPRVLEGPRRDHARRQELLLHANAHHMAVASEPLAAVVARVWRRGGGAITARRRLAGS